MVIIRILCSTKLIKKGVIKILNGKAISGSVNNLLSARRISYHEQLNN